jgi:hypothetical protein
MTVYIRTEEGQMAAYSPDSALPRKLKSLLKVIDGKTPVDVYLNSLRAFGDVEGVLRSLDMAGLIRPMSQLPAGRGLDAEPDAPAHSATIWGISRPSKPSKSEADNTTFRPTMSHSPSTQAAYMHTRSASASDPMANFASNQALARAVDSMSNFVLTYAPEHSFMVLKELELLSNLEQLAVTLGGYEQLIAHVGQPAQEHLLLIKQLLREHM